MSEQGQSNVTPPPDASGLRRATSTDEILGYWKLVAMEQDGVQFQSNDIGKVMLVTEKRITHIRDDVSYPFDIDPTQSPKWIDKYVSRADGMVIRGIYEIEGDELRMLFHGLHHRERPVSLTGIEGHLYLIVQVYRRTSWRPPSDWKARKRRQRRREAMKSYGSLIPPGLFGSKPSAPDGGSG
jgi:uncharacterized protein (TIGR03067 family)